MDAGVANPGQKLKLRLDQSLRCVSSSPDLLEPFGMPAAALVGKYFPDLLVPAEAPTIIETLRGAIEEGAEAVIVASCVHAGGSSWIEMSVVPVDAGAAVLEIEIRDVTRRVSEENRLRAGLWAERSINEIATRLVGWPDYDLDAALALGGVLGGVEVADLRDRGLEVGVERGARGGPDHQQPAQVHKSHQYRYHEYVHHGPLTDKFDDAVHN